MISFLRRLMARANWGVLLYVAILLTVEMCYWIDREYTFRPANDFGKLRDFLLRVGAAGYGAWRLLGWHPVFLKEYRTWLLNTPWDSARPLPLGPVHFVWQDLAVIAGLFAWGRWHATFSPSYLPLCAIVGYLITLMATFPRDRLWVFFYGLIFGLGLVVRFWQQPYIATILALMLYGFALLGLKRTLLELPQQDQEFEEKFWNAFGLPPTAEGTQQWIGWPHDSLAPVAHNLHVTWIHGLLLSLAGGWLFHVAIVLFVLYSVDDSRAQATVLFEALQQGAQLAAADSARLKINAQRLEEARASEGLRMGVLVAMLYVGVPLACCRFLLYRVGYRPPINLWGRLLTSRWIMPLYDRIYGAPLCIVALLAFAWWLGWIRTARARCRRTTFFDRDSANRAQYGANAGDDSLRESSPLGSPLKKSGKDEVRADLTGVFRSVQRIRYANLLVSQRGAREALSASTSAWRTSSVVSLASFADSAASAGVD